MDWFLKVLFFVWTLCCCSLYFCDATIRCFECKDMFKPYLCDIVTLCADNEECYVDQVVTSGGQTLYNSGCRSKQRCSLRKKKNAEVKSPDDFNVTISEDTSSDILTCQTCCSDVNYCNNQGCGEAPLARNQRGPYCFECSNQDEHGCRHVTHCDLNFACEITSKLVDTFRLYDSRCVHITPTSRCNTTYRAQYSQPIAVGKRHTTRDLCYKCCDSDFCNEDCSQTQLPQVPIDGGVTVWSSWSECSTSCGTGTMSRQRSCTNPAPSFGGKPCTEPLSETKSCEISQCPIDGGVTVWSSWSECSSSCRTGTMSRQRSCTNPSPAFGGKPCLEPLSETKSCEISPCPTVIPVIVTWTQWTKCTVSCGQSGIQQRNKICFTSDMVPDISLCQDPVYERRDCNTGVYCPVDGHWGQWSEWSPCPVSCGFGTQTRSRDCNSPPPLNGGKNCDGDGTEHNVCGMGECPVKVNGGWSNWQSWSHCSVTCGSGVRVRTRNCTNPTPSNGGEVCHGNALESHTCHNNSCQDSQHRCERTSGYSLRTYHVPPHNSTHKLCVKMYNFSSTWYAARSQCMQDGADLLTYTSQNSHLNHVFQRFSGNVIRFWIGLEYINHVWTWVDGKTGLEQFARNMLGSHFTKDIHLITVGFSGYRACILDNGHDWLPRDCYERHPFICEKHGNFH